MDKDTIQTTLAQVRVFEKRTMTKGRDKRNEVLTDKVGKSEIKRTTRKDGPKHELGSENREEAVSGCHE